jgi:hypothetical protein
MHNIIFYIMNKEPVILTNWMSYQKNENFIELISEA